MGWLQRGVGDGQDWNPFNKTTARVANFLKRQPVPAPRAARGGIQLEWLGGLNRVGCCLVPVVSLPVSPSLHAQHTGFQDFFHLNHSTGSFSVATRLRVRDSENIIRVGFQVTQAVPAPPQRRHRATARTSCSIRSNEASLACNHKLNTIHFVITI